MSDMHVYKRDETYSAVTQDFIRAMQESHALGATRFEFNHDRLKAVVEWPAAPPETKPPATESDSGQTRR